MPGEILVEMRDQPRLVLAEHRAELPNPVAGDVDGGFRVELHAVSGATDPKGLDRAHPAAGQNRCAGNVSDTFVMGVEGRETARETAEDRIGGGFRRGVHADIAGFETA